MQSNRDALGGYHQSRKSKPSLKLPGTVKQIKASSGNTTSSSSNGPHQSQGPSRGHAHIPAVSTVNPHPGLSKSDSATALANVVAASASTTQSSSGGATRTGSLVGGGGSGTGGDEAASLETQTPQQQAGPTDGSNEKPPLSVLLPNSVVHSSAPNTPTATEVASGSPTRFTRTSSLPEENELKEKLHPTLETIKLDKFKTLLKESTVDLAALRELSWSGIPQPVRAMCWKLLLGYLPANIERREATLERKRKEYHDCIPKFVDIPDTDRTTPEKGIKHQIEADAPRTVPALAFIRTEKFQNLLKRILYIWAIRHPASSYVQGINDLLVPFLAVFLQESLPGVDMEALDVETIDEGVLSKVEADSFWCLSKLLDRVQDHYTAGHPGVQRMLFKMKEVVQRVDAPLAEHLENECIEFMQFAFRWMICYLMRELKLNLVVRVWDTYMAEGDGYSVFHVYVCCALLTHFSEQLRTMEFGDLIQFLQALPNDKWEQKEVEVVLAQAFVWKSYFHDAPSHLY